MNKALRILLVLIALVLVVGLAVLAAQVGGVSVRSAARTSGVGTLTPSSAALLPGVPFTVTVGRVAEEAADEAVLVLRSTESSLAVRAVAASEIAAGELRVVLPCSRAESNSPVRLMLVASDSQAVLAQSGGVSLLPPGPDCALSIK